MSHRNHPRPMIPPKPLPPGGVLLQKTVPAASAPRPFVVLIRGVTDGWKVGLDTLAVKGVTALEAQTIIAWAGDERLALTQPIGQITEDGRIVPAVMPQGGPAPGGAPGPEGTRPSEPTTGGDGDGRPEDSDGSGPTGDAGGGGLDVAGVAAAQVAASGGE